MKGGSRLRSQPVVAGPEPALGLVPPRPGVCRLPTSGQTFSGLTAFFTDPYSTLFSCAFILKRPRDSHDLDTRTVYRVCQEGRGKPGRPKWHGGWWTDQISWLDWNQLLYRRVEWYDLRARTSLGLGCGEQTNLETYFGKH